MPQINTILRVYFTLIFLTVLFILSLFWQYSESDLLSVKLFILAGSISYAVLYLLPSVLLTKLAVSWLKPQDHPTKSRINSVYFVAWITSSLVILIIYGDYKLFELYEYHFNSFVWNLVTTPGGIEALGVTSETIITMLFQVTALMLYTAVALFLVHSLLHTRIVIPKRVFASFISAMLAVLLFEESVHAYSVQTGKEEYLQATEVIPFSFKSRAGSFFTSIGVKQVHTHQYELAQGEINYPLSTIESKPLDNYPNIIMLVAESFRWDLLDPDITPNLWRLSQESITFNQHYSGGNRTRMGLFSMFYGLPAPYWYSFEQQRIAPVLMNVIREKGYQLALHTSQSFSYPELNHTTFSGIPEKFMREIKTGEPWQRDVQNITEIIDQLDQSDKHLPNYTFMFFESTHAPYTFPQDAVIRADYIKEMNYVNLDLLNKIDGMHNRYINAAHHIDKQVGRLLDYLRQNDMMKNTIVLFTGDHGEEFMEKGHWGHGHNATFPEEQVHVPLVLWMPGEQPREINTRTSHTQIPQTLLARLGVTTPPEKYSSAGDLFSPLPYLTMGNYNYMSLFDGGYKVTFPFSKTDYFHYSLYNDHDVKVLRNEKERLISYLEPELQDNAEMCRRFIVDGDKREEGGGVN